MIEDRRRARASSLSRPPRDVDLEDALKQLASSDWELIERAASARCKNKIVTCCRHGMQYDVAYRYGDGRVGSCRANAVDAKIMVAL
jgi:hypothetical protein